MHKFGTMCLRGIFFVSVLSILQFLYFDFSSAEQGDVIKTWVTPYVDPITLPQPGFGPVALNVAIDNYGYIYYTFARFKTLYKLDQDGNLIWTSTMHYANGDPIDGGIGGMCWDKRRRVIWAGSYGLHEHIDVYQLDPVSAIVYPIFSTNAGHQTMGLAYDCTDDSVWLIPLEDAPVPLYQYSAESGALIKTLNLKNQNGSPWTAQMYGLVRVDGGRIFTASTYSLNVEIQIFDKETGIKQGDFSISIPDSNLYEGGLECDPTNLNVMWLRSNWQLVMTAFEVDPATCTLCSNPIIEPYYECGEPIPAYCTFPANDVLEEPECEDGIIIHIKGYEYTESPLTMTFSGADLPGMTVECHSSCSGAYPTFHGPGGARMEVDIEWDPDHTMIGSHPIHISLASDDWGLESNYDFTIEVTSCLHPCCHGNGQCHMTDEETCEFWDGEWHPELQSCEQVDCPSIPCCMPDGTCEYKFTEQECQAAGGAVPDNCYYCEPNPCEDGICCFWDGTCQAMTRCECKEAPGAMAFVGGESCDPNPCPQPAVCCYSDGCALTDRFSCYKFFLAHAGGWHPEWNSCDPDPCPPPCVDPPYGMVAWWPLDASGGYGIIAAHDLVGGNTLWHQGTPVANVGEHVGNSHHFENANDFFEIASPADGSLDLGTGDLSIDCWMRTEVTYPDIRTIVDKRGNPNGAGFSLFIGTSGVIGIQIADPVDHNNWGSSGYVTDGEWHHVAVTVDRDETNQGGKIYVDGVVEGTFNPTVRSGSIDNDGPIRVGQRNISSATPFQGDIDEVQIFDRALEADEVVAIYEADVSGKCEYACYLPPAVSMCEYHDHVHTTLIVGNFTDEAKTFGVSVFGEDEVGWEAKYVPYHETYTLGAGYTEIPVTIYPPDYFGGSESFAIRAGVTCDKGSCTSVSRVQSIPWYNCGVPVSDDDFIAVRFGLIEDVHFDLNNNTAVRDTISYEIRAMAANGDALRHVVSLEGMVPGDSVTGNVVIEPYDSTAITVGVLFTEYDPFVLHSLVLMRDLDDDGIKENVGSCLMQSVRDTAPSTAVHVISFSAVERGGYVDVRWTTAAEPGNAGFNLYRSEGEGGVKIKLNDRLIPAVGNELRGATYTFEDHDIIAGGGYCYWFEDVSLDGMTGMNGPVLVERQDTPTAFSLLQNVPNPFNPVTEIEYALAADCHVRLEIFNVLGQKVTTLVDGHQKAGYRSARWDGTNTNGADVSSGVYFYKLEAGGFTDTKKMVLLR